jgi:CheY-like chemotaxis protein
MGSVDPQCRGAVLVVDDSEDLRAMLREALESQGYVVLEAYDGEDALDVLSLAGMPPVRLIISDLVMPCMSGWELIETLRRDPKLSRIAILVMSALPVHGDASGIGATMSWLRKPFGEEELFAAVDELIGDGSDRHDDGTRSIAPGGRQSMPSHPGH